MRNKYPSMTFTKRNLVALSKDPYKFAHRETKRVVDLDIEIDMHALAEHMGYKAAFNKTRRAKALHGIIKVTARDVAAKTAVA